MTPEELDEIEQRWFSGDSRPYSDVIEALRAAWAERDAMRAELAAMKAPAAPQAAAPVACPEPGCSASWSAEGPTVRADAYCPPFFDTAGRRHVHDRNVTTLSFRCTNGHRFRVTHHHHCWCGWRSGVDSTEVVPMREKQMTEAEMDAILDHYKGLEGFGPTAAIVRRLVAEVRSLRAEAVQRDDLAKAAIAYAAVAHMHAVVDEDKALRAMLAYARAKERA